MALTSKPRAGFPFRYCSTVRACALLDLQNLTKENMKMLTKAAMMGQQAQMSQKSAAQSHQKPGQQQRRAGNVGQPRGKGGSH